MARSASGLDPTRRLWNVCADCGESRAEDGVQGNILRAVLRDDNDALPAELCDVHRFSCSVASGSDNPELRKRLQQQYGDRAFIDSRLPLLQRYSAPDSYDDARDGALPFLFAGKSSRRLAVDTLSSIQR